MATKKLSNKKNVIALLVTSGVLVGGFILYKKFGSSLGLTGDSPINEGWGEIGNVEANTNEPSPGDAMGSTVVHNYYGIPNQDTMNKITDDIQVLRYGSYQSLNSGKEVSTAKVESSNPDRFAKQVGTNAYIDKSAQQSISFTEYLNRSTKESNPTTNIIKSNNSSSSKSYQKLASETIKMQNTKAYESGKQSIAPRSYASFAPSAPSTDNNLTKQSSAAPKQYTSYASTAPKKETSSSKKFSFKSFFSKSGVKA